MTWKDLWLMTAVVVLCGDRASWAQTGENPTSQSGWNISRPPQYIAPPSPGCPLERELAQQEAVQSQEGDQKNDKTPNPLVQDPLSQAYQMMSQGQVAEAARHFERLADTLSHTQPAANEARYLQAECLRLQSHYPAAAAAYVRLLNDFPCGNFRKEAIARVYDIANFWLDDTRQEIQQRHRHDGQQVVIWPHLLHWDRSKPLWNQEDEALGLLEAVVYHDPVGSRADKALFLLASVRLFREDYADADRCYSRLVEHYPHSPLAPLAIVRAIVCKRRSLETCVRPAALRNQFGKQIETALRKFPTLDEEDVEFLHLQLCWKQWQEWREVLPAWVVKACALLVEQALPEFPEGSKYEETFLTQRGAAWSCPTWVRGVPNMLFAPCQPFQAVVGMLADQIPKQPTVENTNE